MSATDPRSVTFPRARVVRAHTFLLLHRFFRGGADARRGDDDMGGVSWLACVMWVASTASTWVYVPREPFALLASVLQAASSQPCIYRRRTPG